MPRYEINHYAGQVGIARAERDDREVVEAPTAREALEAAREAHEMDWPIDVRDDDFASASDPETSRSYERSIIAERVEDEEPDA